MKTAFYSLLLLTPGLGTLASAQAPALPGVGELPQIAPAVSYKPARMIGMSPDSKRQLLIKANERNPYASRSPGEQEVDGNGENVEEIEIRKTLSSLSVTGMSRGQNGLRILLGDIIIEQGRILPELLPDQSEDLKVIEISEDSVTLAWLDIESSEPTGKTLQLAFDLTPSVSYALHGQRHTTSPDGEGGSALAERQMGVMRIGQERMIERRRMAAKDPARDLPREVYEAAQ